MHAYCLSSAHLIGSRHEVRHEAQITTDEAEAKVAGREKVKLNDVVWSAPDEASPDSTTSSVAIKSFE